MKRFLELVLVLVVFVLVVSGGQEKARAQDRGNSKVQQGLAIAPLPLNLQGRNRALVGLGSYIVNAQGDCNGCHTVEFNPYIDGGNPFVGELEMIDPAKYLVGGSAFGPLYYPESETGSRYGASGRSHVRRVPPRPAHGH